MMRNREIANGLNKSNPNLTFEEFLEKKQKVYKLQGENAFKDIIRSSKTTNKRVDKSLGLEE
ncbi:hypothetical protein ACFVR1_11380 [Psychrobacillus sp. NPDC058041]|uniref:hypothetical protein n=1 Tax=Psychrobacillus sp. NPDC058041 TaxID=3346310 RepID=UPI0036DF0EE7